MTPQSRRIKRGRSRLTGAPEAVEVQEEEAEVEDSEVEGDGVEEEVSRLVRQDRNEAGAKI